MFNPLSAELIFHFLSYSAYLIVLFAFFSILVVTTTTKFCGKVPDRAVSIHASEILHESFEGVYICCSFCSCYVVKVKVHDSESCLFGGQVRSCLKVPLVIDRK